MSGYTKLFNSILASTVWQAPHHVRVVWISMLAMADRYGEVMASVPGLAQLSGVTLPECESALTMLSAPDPYSRTKDHEGRRIEAIDGGWEILNHAKYRAKQSADEQRAKAAERQARKRARDAAASRGESRSVTDGHGESRSVTPGHDKQMQIPEAEAPEKKPRARRARSDLEVLIVASYETLCRARQVQPVAPGAEKLRRVAAWVTAQAGAEPVAAFLDRWLGNAFASPDFQAKGFPWWMLSGAPAQFLQAHSGNGKSSHREPGNFDDVPETKTLFGE